MAKTKNEPNIIEDALRAAGFSDQEPDSNAVTDMNDMVNDTIINDVDKINNPDDKPSEGNSDTDKFDDKSDIPDNILNNNNSSDDNNDNNDSNDGDDDDIHDPNEAEQVTAFFDAFAEAMHWDVEDDEKPNTVQGIIDYMSDVVAQNSKPSYSDPRVEQLDNYVKNGGSFDDFYNGLSQEIQYDSLNMEDESNQKTAIREYLTMQGYTNDQINSKIERYEDADMLEDEANDAVERLKTIKKQQLEHEQMIQQQQAEEQYRQVQEFSNNLNTSISNLTNIRGINVPKEDRKALLEYITRTDENGLTQYQKDFNSNLVNNLIESAYFTMKGDTLLGNARREGTTDAAAKLRTMLRHSSKNRTSQRLDDNKRSAVDIASKLFG